jgi:hypothetical protein
MNKLQRYLLVGSIALSTLLPVAAFAQITSNTALPGTVATRFGTFEAIINSAFSITILLSGIVFVFLMLLGGVQYLTSLGDEDGTTKARKIILNGAIGLVIVLTSFAIGTYVLQLLGLGNRSGELNTTDTIRGGGFGG